MKIKKRLQLNIAVSVLTALAASLVFFLALYRMNAANDSEQIADDIISSVLERDVLRNDFIRNNGARAKEQWFSRHEQIGRLLKQASENFRDTEDRKNIAEMIDDHESIGNIFSAIVANREKSYSNPGPANLSREVEDRLLSQLNMRVYEVVIHNRKMLESTRKARVAALGLAGGGVIFALLILIAAAITNSWTMGRAVADRVGRLREGAELIELGDMDHKIVLKGDDEFAEIAESFNAMTATLRGSYRNLENEIEERKRAEKALRESEEKLALALRSAEMGVWRLDLGKKKRYFDGQVCRILGIDPGNFNGSAEEFFKAVHPDDRDGIKAALDRTIASGVPYEVEYRAVWPDGRVHHIAARGQLTRDASGQPQWVDGLAWDITERKQVEEAMRESRAKLEAALASMTDAVFISDAEGRSIEFNEAFATFHRFANKGECAKTFAEYPDILDVFLPDGTPAPLEMWAVPRSLRGETEANAEYTLHRKDTGEYWVGSYSFGPIRDADGKIVGSVVVSRDITDRKLAEQTLQEAHDELARLVKERTRELAEKEVMLKEIHHRVKNNLQVISSLVGLQADGSTDETVRDVLRDVTYRVRSMALVHEKLYQSADLAHVDFAEYSRGLLGYLWRAQGASAASIRLNQALSPVELPVDTAVPLGLILNELAGNALKHAFRGREEGEVTVSLQMGGDGRISLGVGDNGVGLPEGLDWRKTPSLGLRLVQMLSAQLGGEVNVESGEGTRFEISFGV